MINIPFNTKNYYFTASGCMSEFVSAGGELIIHGALHLKNSNIPELINKKQKGDFDRGPAITDSVIMGNSSPVVL